MTRMYVTDTVHIKPNRQPLFGRLFRYIQFRQAKIPLGRLPSTVPLTLQQLKCARS